MWLDCTDAALRQASTGHLRTAIKTELPHDYVKLPIGEIERRLFG